MTAAYVQLIGATDAGTSTTTVLSVTKTVTAGNTIIAGGCYFAASGTETLVDNLGNTYTRVERVSLNARTATLWYAPVTNAGSLTTITFTHPSNSYHTLVADEFSGVGTLASAGGATGRVGTYVTWDTSATIPANGLAIGVAMNTVSANTVSAGAASGSPSTSLTRGANTVDSLSTALIYAIAGSSTVTAFSGTGTATTSGDWSAAGANFNPTGIETDADAVTATATGVAHDATATKSSAAPLADVATGTGQALGAEAENISAGWYIEPSGSDTTGDGSKTNPWRTIAKFVSTARSPGDTLWVRGGTYTSVPTALIGNAAVQTGTAEAPITIRAYPGEVPIFTGPSTTPAYGGLIAVSWGCSYIVIDGLTTTATFSPVQMGLIDIGQTGGRTDLVHHITVRNCVLRGKATGTQSEHGIYVSEYTGNITLEYNTIIGPASTQAYNLTGGGIHLYHDPICTSLIVQRNIIEDWQWGFIMAPSSATGTAEILHNSFLGCYKNIALWRHGTVLLQDNAGETAAGGSAFNVDDPNNSANTTNDNNFWGQTFDANYYLDSSDLGYKAANDGSDAGALDNPGSTVSVNAEHASGTGTGHQPTATMTNTPKIVYPELAVATGTAYQPNITIVETQTQVYAGHATGTGTAYTPPFARLGIPTVLVAVDFANDGSFATAGDDITADVLSDSLTWTRGRSADFSAEATGAASFTLRDDEGTYTAKIAAGTLVPGRPVHLQATYLGITYPIFFGYVQRITPDAYSRTVAVTCYDVLQRLSETDVVVPAITIMARSARDFRIAALEEYERGSRNFLVNPSFETDVSHWEYLNGTLVRDATDGASGSACATLTWTSSTATAWATARLLPYSLANQVYRFSVYLKAASPQAAVIGIGEDAGISVYRARTVAVTTSWQRFSLTFTAPTTRLGNSLQMLRGYVAITSGAVKIDAAMLTRGQGLVTYSDSGTGRWMNLCANGSLDGSSLNGWTDTWANLCANPSFETNTTGWAGTSLSRVSTAPRYGSWHGSSTVLTSVTYSFSGITFKQGITYDLLVSARTATSSSSIGVRLGSSGTPTDSATASLASISTTYATYAVSWTPSADRADVVFSITGYASGAGYVDGLQVVRRGVSLSAGPSSYADTGIGGGGSFVTSYAVSATAKYGSLSQSFTTPATAGSGRLYDFYHDGAAFLSGVTYTASLWAYSSVAMPYRMGIGANRGDGGYDEASTSGLLAASTWTQVVVSWTPIADRLNSANHLDVMLYFQQTNATSHTILIDGVRVIPAVAVDDFEPAQWSLDTAEADIYGTDSALSGTALSVLAQINALSLTRHWIAPSSASPWYTYTTRARASLATKVNAETYADDVASLTTAEIDRTAIYNLVGVSYIGGTEYYGDAASVSSYGLSPAPDVGGGSFLDLATADEIGPTLIERYSQPRARPTMTVVNRFPSQLERELDDLVTVTYPRLGITAREYLVLSMTTRLSDAGNTWTTEYVLEEYA